MAGPWHNTMVMAWVHDENQQLDLGSLSKRYGVPVTKDKLIRQRGGRLYFDTKWPLDSFEGWPESVRRRFLAYNRDDVVVLRDLYNALRRRLVASEWYEYWLDEEASYSSILLDMECRGMPINLHETNKLAIDVRNDRDAAEHKLRRLARLPETFNLNSPAQLRAYLFTPGSFTLPGRFKNDEVPEDFHVTEKKRVYSYGYWVVRGRGLAPTDPPERKGKEPSTDPSTASPELLYKHPHDPWVRSLCLDYRRASKLLGTYLDKFPKIAQEGRIFGRFNQTGTVTGRLSSSDPNLQNIPARREAGKRVRALFQGNLVIGDYDALEMRLMAHFSRDRRLLQVFRDGVDPHARTAEAVFGRLPAHESPEREIGKTLNYAIGYGAGARKLAQTLSLAGFPTDVGTARDYLKAVEDFYPTLFAYRNRVIYNTKQVGYINTIGGRARRVFAKRDEMATWKMAGYGERQAFNALLQGSAADILRRVMMYVVPRYPELQLIAQVHDELLWEFDDARPPTYPLMEALQVDCETGHGFDLAVPLSFVPVVCDNWSQKGEGVPDFEEDQ